MRVLITGANGILGRALTERLGGGNTLYLWGREEADVTDAAAVRAAARGIDFEAVVHGAAYTNVDGAEREPDLAMAVNRDGAANVAALARERGALFLYVSSDYVFDGESARPYQEDDPTNPLSSYGRSKRAGEEASVASGARCLIVRTSWLFGPGGRNFVDTIASKAQRGEPLEVVDDQHGAPTYARDLAHGIELLLRRGAEGTVHVTNSGATTWHGLAVEVVRTLGASVAVTPVSSARLSRPAPRPRNSVLAGNRFAALTGGPLPPWEDAVHRHLAGPTQRTGAAA